MNYKLLQRTKHGFSVRWNELYSCSNSVPWTWMNECLFVCCSNGLQRSGSKTSTVHSAAFTKWLTSPACNVQWTTTFFDFEHDRRLYLSAMKHSQGFFFCLFWCVTSYQWRSCTAASSTDSLFLVVFLKFRLFYLQNSLEKYYNLPVRSNMISIWI